MLGGHSKLNTSTTSKLPPRIRELYVKHGERITKALKEKHHDYGTTPHEDIDVFPINSDTDDKVNQG